MEILCPPCNTLLAGDGLAGHQAHLSKTHAHLGLFRFSKPIKACCLVRQLLNSSNKGQGALSIPLTAGLVHLLQMGLVQVLLIQQVEPAATQTKHITVNLLLRYNGILQPIRINLPLCLKCLIQ